jgi:tetratricopeptide (TPR) repeat protein
MTGNIKLEQEKYADAIKHYREELTQHPDNLRAREKLGFAYYKTDQYDESIDAFSQVLQKDPKRPYATYYLGLAYLKSGERSKAIEIFKSYENKQQPLLEEQIKKQITLLEFADSIHLAKQAVSEEQKLKTLPPKPGTVAVFYFKDVSPENRLRPFQKALATMITTDLSQVKSLRVLERSRVQFLLREMELGETGIVEEKTAPRYGRLLGANDLVVGTIEPRSFHVKATVASVSEGKSVGVIAVGGQLEQFYIIEKEIVYNILQVLHVKFTPEEEEKFSQYHTKNLKAVVFFGQGLEALDAGEWKEAKNYFRQAVEEDPEFKLAILYRDGCPSATAPSLGTLSGMTDAGLADMVDSSISETADAAAGLSGEGHGPDAAGGDEGPGFGGGAGAGSVGVSW